MYQQIRGVRAVQASVSQMSLAEAPPTSDLAACIEAMRRGDEAGLESLYEATVGKLYALAVAILRSKEDAEEVVWSTYAYAWSNAQQFDPARASAMGWLLMLCRSRALDRLRQRRATRPALDIADVEPASEDTPAEDLLSMLQQSSRVRGALAQLSPTRRQLVTLAFLQGLSHPEIAAATGLPLGTVKSHMRRALGQLRAALEDEG
jgi:RNA polymerase sigma-70 factor (ECF subfamily)